MIKSNMPVFLGRSWSAVKTGIFAIRWLLWTLQAFPLGSFWWSFFSTLIAWSRGCIVVSWWRGSFVWWDRSFEIVTAPRGCQAAQLQQRYASCWHWLCWFHNIHRQNLKLTSVLTNTSQLAQRNPGQPGRHSTGCVHRLAGQDLEWTC